VLDVGRQFFKNLFSSWFAYLIRIVITFLFVPYITTVLGGERYGVWVIIFQTIFYFSLLDCGFSSALTRYISKYLSQKDFQGINRILNSANLLYLVIGAVVFAGVYPFVSFFFEYFKISDPILMQEGKNALLILGAFMAFNFIALPFGNSLGAFHRYDIVNGLNIAEEIIRTGLMIFMLYRGNGLVELALVILLLTVVKHLVGAAILLKLYPKLNIAPQNRDKPTIKMLYGYSKISLGISMCWLLIYNTDTVLLGIMSSSSAAAIYYPGAQLMRYLRNVINAVAIPLVPAISHLETVSDLSVIREIYLRAIKYISYFSFAVAGGVIVYAQFFVNLWLPPEFTQAGLVMQILAVGTAFLLPQIIGESVLFAVEQHRKLLLVLIIEAIIKLALAFPLIKMYGIIGMAYSVMIPQILLFTTLYPYIMAKVLKSEFSTIIKVILKAAIPGLLISMPLGNLLQYVYPPLTWFAFFVNMIIILIAVIILGYLISDTEDRKKITGWFRIF